MNWYDQSRPGEIRPTPWLHPAAVEYLAGIVGPDTDVIEHGAGGSTLWFATRARSVLSIEHNPDWHAAIMAIRPPNVALVLGEYPPNATGDIIFIDGLSSARPRWLNVAPKMVRPGGWIVLDNSNRPEYAGGRGMLRDSCAFYVTFFALAGAKPVETEFYKWR